MSLPLKEAVICYLRRGDYTLFIDYTDSEHIIHRGKYSAPGGKIKPGETPEQTAFREVQEETGIVPRVLEYRGKALFRNEERTIEGEPMTHNWLVYFFDCKDFDNVNERATEGKLSWTHNNDISKLPLHEGDRLIWERWLTQHQQFNGEIIHKGESLTSAELIS